MAYIKEHQMLAVAATAGRLRLQATRKMPTSDLFPTMAGLYAATPNHTQENWGARNIVTECRNLCAHLRAHADGAEIFYAFLATCHDHWWRHAKLVTLFDHAAERKMSNLITLVLGVNTGLLAAKNVILLVSRPVETPVLADVVSLLKRDILGFTELHGLALRSDTAIACRVDVRAEIKERPFAPSAVPAKPVAHRSRGFTALRLRSGD